MTGIACPTNHFKLKGLIPSIIAQIHHARSYDIAVVALFSTDNIESVAPCRLRHRQHQCNAPSHHRWYRVPTTGAVQVIYFQDELARLR